MPMVKWNDSYLLGVMEIDKHHQHLVELLNKTHEEFMKGAPAESIGAVLDKLINYATYHFISEEQLMVKIGDPGLAEHREEHGRFTRRVVEIQTDFHSGNKNLSNEVLLFLKNWLTNHILKTDAMYGQFITDHKIKVD